MSLDTKNSVVDAADSCLHRRCHTLISKTRNLSALSSSQNRQSQEHHAWLVHISLINMYLALEGYAIWDAGSDNHGRVGHETLAGLVVAAPHCRPDGPLDHRGHHEAYEPQRRPNNLAPARVVGVAALNTQRDRNARHRAKIDYKSSALPEKASKNHTNQAQEHGVQAFLTFHKLIWPITHSVHARSSSKLTLELRKEQNTQEKESQEAQQCKRHSF